jgi:hypothetical protein
MVADPAAPAALERSGPLTPPPAQEAPEPPVNENNDPLVDPEIDVVPPDPAVAL